MLIVLISNQIHEITTDKYLLVVENCNNNTIIFLWMPKRWGLCLQLVFKKCQICQELSYSTSKKKFRFVSNENAEHNSSKTMLCTLS